MFTKINKAAFQGIQVTVYVSLYADVHIRRICLKLLIFARCILGSVTCETKLHVVDMLQPKQWMQVKALAKNRVRWRLVVGRYAASRSRTQMTVIEWPYFIFLVQIVNDQFYTKKIYLSRQFVLSNNNMITRL